MNSIVPTKFIELILPAGCDHETMLDVQDRGVLEGVFAKFSDGAKYELSFYTPERVAFELRLGLEHGYCCIGGPGLVVINQVTAAQMEEAVLSLEKEGFFLALKSYTEVEKLRSLRGLPTNLLPPGDEM